MKKIKTVIITMLLYMSFYGQELPKIIPPSPNTAGFHVYGNTQVNNYTGSANITIPIYDIKDGDLSLPIYLKYTAGNGIKVEEMSGWVGLGWTLNTGGAISRTIRGIADDDIRGGLLYNNKLPDPDDSLTRLGIIANEIDTESDKFMYNFPGGSGSFFYNYDNTYTTKPLKKIDISHSFGVDLEDPVYNNIPYCSTQKTVLKDFTITDTYGNSYFFRDKERSNSKVELKDYTTDESYPSSWFLNTIENKNKTRSINLTYDTYSYSLIRRQAVLNNNSSEQDTHIETIHIGKRLSKITFSQGSVEFIASSNIRKDMDGNNFLDKIIVKDIFDNVIKSIQFTYKYMTPSGLVTQDADISIDDENNRLFLEKTQEFDARGNSKPAHIFTYDISHVLPNRFSKSVDHWGYYNGENNDVLEPKQYITYYHRVDSEWQTIVSGEADRNPNEAYAKAGILTSIEYPTGGKTNFFYENHTAVNYDLPGKLIEKGITLKTEGYKDSIDIKLYSNKMLFSRFRRSGIMQNPTSCDMRIHIKNENYENSFLIQNDQSFPSTTSSPELYLEPGKYAVWFTYESGTVSCDTTEDSFVFLQWDEEESSDTKLVGGLRLSTVIDYTDENTIANTTTYDYTDETGSTSGRVVNMPIYYGLTMISDDSIPNFIVPLWYKKFINSMYPLATTSGSNVGYGKVTVTNSNTANGKTEFFYTTAEDYPDTFNVLNPYTGDPIPQIYDGKKINYYPVVQTDDKDFVRGLLKEKIIYKKKCEGEENSCFEEIYREKVDYNLMKYSTGVNPIPTTKANRSSIYKSSSEGQYHLYYDIYSGYALEREIKEVTSNTNGDIISRKTNTYQEDENFVITNYIPIETETQKSNGDTVKNETSFVFNKTPKTNIEDELFDLNALYLPIKTKTSLTKDGVTKQLSETYTIYNTFGNLYLPDTIQTAKGTASLEDRIIYHDYDDKGNPTEVSKADGTHIVYLWGYNQTQPIAKIEAATYTEVTSAIASISNTNYNTLAKIQGLSDADDDSNILNDDGTITYGESESALREALQKLREALDDAQVSTYTYDPLIGVTSMTDPRGYTMYYEYDGFNRLKHVKDTDGNILSENQYNYKN